MISYTKFRSYFKKLHQQSNIIVINVECILNLTPQFVDPDPFMYLTNNKTHPFISTFCRQFFVNFCNPCLTGYVHIFDNLNGNQLLTHIFYQLATCLLNYHLATGYRLIKINCYNRMP
jgi:hypothetical protein